MKTLNSSLVKTLNSTLNPKPRWSLKTPPYSKTSHLPSSKLPTANGTATRAAGAPRPLMSGRGTYNTFRTRIWSSLANCKPEVKVLKHLRLLTSLFERTRHMLDSRDQNLVLAFRWKSSKPFKLSPLRSEAASKTARSAKTFDQPSLKLPSANESARRAQVRTPQSPHTHTKKKHTPKSTTPHHTTQKSPHKRQHKCSPKTPRV